MLLAGGREEEEGERKGKGDIWAEESAWPETNGEKDSPGEGDAGEVITAADNEGMGGDTGKINFKAEIKMVKGKRDVRREE